MKNRMKKTVTALLVGSMILGGGSVSYAAGHTCAFAYMGDEVTSPSTVVGSHMYNKYNDVTGQMDVVTCYISAETRSQVEKCACGAKRYGKSTTYIHHSVCGL